MSWVAESLMGSCNLADDGSVGGSQGRDVGGWIPRPVRGGHSGPVVDMCWAADGACLLTVSADQTGRIFTRCRGSWCEIARPEVRGPFQITRKCCLHASANRGNLEIHVIVHFERSTQSRPRSTVSPTLRVPYLRDYSP
jgi:hypothetical protein